MRVFNSERLKSARIYRGYTLSDLAEKIGVSKQALSLYENNKSVPDAKNIMAISSVLRFPHTFFFQKDDLNVHIEQSTYFRSLLTTNRKELLAQSVRVEYIAKFFSFLTNYLEFPKLNIPEINVEEEFDADLIAENVRNYWGIGNSPITEFRYLLESNGIIVNAIQTDYGVDAFSQKTLINSVATYFIIVSKDSQTATRANFDMAHELAHILLHPWNEDLLVDITKEEFRLREGQANMFAGALLLPKDAFIKDLTHPNNLDSYRYLKLKWNTSIQAMVYRARSLDLISHSQYQYLFRKISSSGWRQKEPGDTIFSINNGMIQSAVKVLIKNNVLTGDEIIKNLSKMGLTIDGTEFENLLCLEEGVLSQKISNDIKIINFTPK